MGLQFFLMKESSLLNKDDISPIFNSSGNTLVFKLLLIKLAVIKKATERNDGTERRNGTTKRNHETE